MLVGRWVPTTLVGAACVIALSGCGTGPVGEAVATTPSTSVAEAASVEEAVLAAEARWLQAITAGDRATIETILLPDFRHTTADGVILDRAQEIEGIVPLTATFTASEQVVNIYDDTAVVHGINTVTEGQTVVARERFTDVFIKRDGVWMALAAQETAIP